MSNTPETLKYTKDHEWAKIEGDVATIGITAFNSKGRRHLLKALGSSWHSAFGSYKWQMVAVALLLLQRQCQWCRQWLGKWAASLAVGHARAGNQASLFCH